jgi:hypothetical protein
MTDVLTVAEVARRLQLSDHVGITSQGPHRWRAHERDQAWWGEVVRSTAEHFEVREKALEAERAAIQTEAPRYNVVHANPAPERAAPIYRRHGAGSITRIAATGRWAAVTPAPERRWFRFAMRDQAEAFLSAWLAAEDPDVRAALKRALR